MERKGIRIINQIQKVKTLTSSYIKYDDLCNDLTDYQILQNRQPRIEDESLILRHEDECKQINTFHWLKALCSKVGKIKTV